jgi:uncharacterized protein YutE (UPF0331/DUF86 family)
MTPVEKEVVRRKLAIIVENLKTLEPIKDMTLEQYASDVYKRKATERLSQELIEAAIDINTHIIVHTHNTIVDDYYESFIKMGDINVIPVALANELAPSAGLRNVLVHEYDALNNSIVLEAVKVAGNIYPQYINSVEKYISSQD